MPNPSLQDAIKEAYAVAPTDAIIYHTLEFYHPLFDYSYTDTDTTDGDSSATNSNTIRVVEGFKDLTATLETSAPRNPSTPVTFQAYPFRVTLPPIFDKSAPELSIVIDNVSRDILTQIQRLPESLELLELIYRPYISTDLSTPQYDPPIALHVVGINATVSTITATCRYRDLANVQFPRNVYNTREFPGLQR